MQTFKNGVRFTFYETDNVFSDEALPVNEEYTINGNALMIDFNFRNTGIYDLKVTCDNNIVEFYVDGELNSTLYKRGSNYADCL